VTAKIRRRHSAEFQADAVRKLNNSGQSAEELAGELNVSPSLLYRWRRAAKTKEGSMPKKKSPPTNEPGRRPQDWTTEQKLSVVLDAQGLAEEQLGGFLRQRGLHEATLSDWRETVLRGAKAELGGRSDKQPSLEAKRIRELERELARKDKALAEAAALLMLQKKFRALMGAEDDDTEPKSGR
jgi:transposase